MERPITDQRLADGRWLRIPGPTPVPPAVLSAMTQPMIPHRGSEMSDLLGDIREKLQTVMRTEGAVAVWSGSGSAGWEAAIQNSCQPGDRVIATVCGEFGKRFADLAERFGLEVHRIVVPGGEAVAPVQLEDALATFGDVKAVLVTHNETATGVTNPLADLAEIARAAGALVLVDAVSSAAAMPLEADAWGLDWVISGSQKAWMCPPGLMLASISERALEVASRNDTPRFFWDAHRAANGFASGQAPTTPPISLLWALDAALAMMLEEGVERMWERQACLGATLRQALVGLGLELFAQHDVASASVTAVRPPDGMRASALRDLIRADSGIEVAVGQGDQRDAVIRIGHMGWTHQPELDATIESIERVLTARQ